MTKCYYNATLVLADRLLPGGWVLVEEGKIRRYGEGEVLSADEMIDCKGEYLSPGFIDVHCHGGGGGSFSAGGGKAQAAPFHSHAVLQLHFLGNAADGADGGVGEVVALEDHAVADDEVIGADLGGKAVGSLK